MAGYIKLQGIIVFVFSFFVGSAYGSSALNNPLYHVYYGDIDSVEYGLDGHPDILLRARQRFIMLTVGVSFPVGLDSEYRDLLFCGTSSGDFIPCTKKDDAMIPAKPSDLFDDLIGDLDGDGIVDLFLKSKDPSINSLFLSNNSNGDLSLKDQFLKIGDHWVSGGGGVSIRDSSQDDGEALVLDDLSYSEWSDSGFSEPRSLNLDTSLVGSSASSFSVDLGQVEFSLPLSLIHI